MNQEEYIQRCFELALKGFGSTWPNPMVGAVIVKNGKIIGEGFHQAAGQDHAEVDALKNCKESVAGATIYVNLEPCCHTNKQTPPCAQRLIDEKIAKVVICNLDPNPAVNGKGVELLRQNGIEVEHGILSEFGESLNEVFFHAQRGKTPFVHLKMASTLDGKTALPSGESKWITGVAAREQVHYMRSIHQGIVVGAETVRKDNPQLNVRLPDFDGVQPWRIVFSESGELPSASHLFQDELKDKTLIYTKNKLKFDFPSAQVIQINSLKEAMNDLFERKIINLMLEGGANLASEFFKAGFINRVTLFINPSFLGSGSGVLGDLGITSLENRPKLQDVQTSFVGEDLLLTGRIK